MYGLKAYLCLQLLLACSVILGVTEAITKVVVPAVYKEWREGAPDWATNRTLQEQLVGLRFPPEQYIAMYQCECECECSTWRLFSVAGSGLLRVSLSAVRPLQAQLREKPRHGGRRVPEIHRGPLRFIPGRRNLRAWFDPYPFLNLTL